MADTLTIPRGDLTLLEAAVRAHFRGPELYRYVALLDHGIRLSSQGRRGDDLDRELAQFHEEFTRSTLEGRDWLYGVTKSANQMALDALQVMSNFDVGGSVGGSVGVEGTVDFSINPFGILRDLATIRARTLDAYINRYAAGRAHEAQWGAKQEFDLRATMDRFAARAAKNPDLARAVDKHFPDFPEQWSDALRSAWFTPAWPPPPTAPTPTTPAPAKPPVPPGLRMLPPVVQKQLLSCQRDDGEIILRIEDMVGLVTSGFAKLADDLALTTDLLAQVRAAQQRALELAAETNSGVSLLVGWMRATQAREEAEQQAQQRKAASDAVLRTQTTVLVAATRLLTEANPKIGVPATIAAQTYLEAVRTAGEVSATFAAVTARAGDSVGTVVSGLLLTGNLVGIVLNVVDAVAAITGAAAPSESKQILDAVNKVQQVVVQFANATLDRLEHLDARLAELRRTVLTQFDLVDRRLRGIEVDLGSVRADLAHVRRDLDRLGGTVERDLQELNRGQLTGILDNSLGWESRMGRPLEYMDFGRAETDLASWALQKSQGHIELPTTGCTVAELPQRLTDGRPLADRLGLIAAVIAAEFSGMALVRPTDFRNPVTWTLAADGLAALVMENPAHAAAMPACERDLNAVEEAGRYLADGLAALARTRVGDRWLLEEVAARYTAAARDAWKALETVQDGAVQQWRLDHRNYPPVHDVWRQGALIQPDALLQPDAQPESLRHIYPAVMSETDKEFDALILLTPWELIEDVPAAIRCHEYLTERPTVRLEYRAEHHDPFNHIVRVTLRGRLTPDQDWASASTVMTWTITTQLQTAPIPGGGTVTPLTPAARRRALQRITARRWGEIQARGTRSADMSPARAYTSWAEMIVGAAHHQLLVGRERSRECPSVQDAQEDALTDAGSAVHAGVLLMTGYRTLLLALAELAIPRGLMVDDLLQLLLNGQERLVDFEQVAEALARRRRSTPVPKLGREWVPPTDTLPALQEATWTRTDALVERLRWQRGIHEPPEVRDVAPDLDRATTTLNLVRQMVANWRPGLLAEPPPLALSEPPSSPPPRPPLTTGVCRYQVRAGDSWWRIAERLLGDGRRADDVRRANPTVVMLHPGNVIAVPWPAGEVTHTVLPREGFWVAARAAYGRVTTALVAQVVAWNGGDERRVLTPGEVLYCPAQASDQG